MKSLQLTPQERVVIEEAFAPYIQAVTIVAKLRGLNPATAQLSADRQTFLVAEDAPSETNGIKSFG